MSLNLRYKTAAQLQKLILHGTPAEISAASYEWAERIERNEKPRCCLPKKKQRQLGILPPLVLHAASVDVVSDHAGHQTGQTGSGEVTP